MGAAAFRRSFRPTVLRGAGVLALLALLAVPGALLADGGPTQTTGPDLRPLAAVAGQALESVRRGNLGRASDELVELGELWEDVEGSVHATDLTAYAAVETASSRSGAALRADPPSVELARKELESLLAAFDSYDAARGRTGAGGRSYGVGDLLGILQSVEAELGEGNTAEAADRLGDFQTVWPLAEAEIRTRSAEAYERIESGLTDAAALLASRPVDAPKATALIRSMSGVLEPLKESARYSVWDAGLILLREGLEALLVLAALLATLRKSGRGDAKGWVWSGATVGVVASVALALVLRLALSSASTGTAREQIEGIVGLASVLLMMSVGVWFHRYTSIRAWDGFLKGTVGKALARGSLLTLAGVAFLAVFREGAETVILFIAIATGMSAVQLAVGILAALVLLVIAGVLIIRLAVRLPLHAVFLVATILIYYLAFKILGQSVHALQIAGAIPSHTAPFLPSLGLLGMYRSWETFLPQLALLLVIAAMALWNRVRKKAQLKARAA